MRLLIALLLVAFPAVAIPPSVIGTTPGRKPKVAVSDDFNRANGALGANWTAGPGYASGSIVSGEWAGSNTVNANTWTANTFNADQYSEIVISSYGTNGSAFATVRADPATNTYYFGGGTSYGDANLYRSVNGNVDVLDSNVNQNYTIYRLEVVGTTISLYGLAAHGGTKSLVFQVTDANITTGSPGIVGYTESGLATVNNWYGGDL